MPYRPFADQQCSIAAALAVLGERWTLLVLREALLGRRRFVEFQQRLGVAPNILTDRLQTLVEHGLLRRRPLDEGGGSPEYVLTERGRDVEPVLTALMQWGDRHVTPPGGPPRVLVHELCGHDARPEWHCAHCGEALHPSDLYVRPGPGATQQQRREGRLPAPRLSHADGPTT